jgi:FHA domain-containing protein
MPNEIVDKIRGWIKPWMKGTEPLEIRRAVLEDAESRVVPAGGGKRLFPYNRIRVHILTPDPRERIELEALVQEGWNLREEIAARLRDRGAPVPPDLDVQVVFDEEVRPEYADRRFFLVYERTETAGAAVATPGQPARPGRRPVRPVLELTILKGAAAQRVYTVTADRVYLGRMAEIVDSEGRVKRRNDIAFQEDGEINQTVSREHARIAWDDATGGWWLRAEQPAAATRIFREGRTIDIPAHDRRGVRLAAGDEVYLGRACLKVGVRAPERLDS